MGPPGCGLLARSFLPGMAAISAFSRDQALDRLTYSRAVCFYDWPRLRGWSFGRRPLLSRFEPGGVSSDPDVADRVAAGGYRGLRGRNSAEETFQQRVRALTQTKTTR